MTCSAGCVIEANEMQSNAAAGGERQRGGLVKNLDYLTPADRVPTSRLMFKRGDTAEVDCGCCPAPVRPAPSMGTSKPWPQA